MIDRICRLGLPAYTRNTVNDPQQSVPRLAAISVGGPDRRIIEERALGLAPKVIEHADLVSVRLGWQPPKPASGRGRSVPIGYWFSRTLREGNAHAA